MTTAPCWYPFLSKHVWGEPLAVKAPLLAQDPTVGAVVPNGISERSSLMLKLTLRYIRYALSALATIGFVMQLQ